MLSSVGRAAVKRVVAGGPESTNRALQTIWQFQRVALSQRTSDASTRSNVLFGHMRLYATTTKDAPKTKTTSTTTAKPKAKKAPLKKAPVKKPVKKPAKRGRAILKKKPVKKPIKKKAKKVLTEAQQKRAELKELKAKALTTPDLKPNSAWKAFVSMEFDKVPGTIRSGKMKEISARFKALSPSELESINHTVNANIVANEVTYKTWIESHTPDQIRLANNARTLLRRKFKLSKNMLVDSRLPKRPLPARLFFAKERYNSGDLKGISFAEASRLITKEWDALSASEKKTYEDQSAGDRARYVQEFKTVYHRDSQTKLT